MIQLNDQMMEVLRQMSIRATVMTQPGHYTPGKQAQIWAKYHNEVAEFIRAQKLPQIQVTAEHAQTLTASTGVFVWWNPAGGWPLPHFHLGDNMFAATDAQWQQFSSAIIQKVGTQLQSVKAMVGFNQLVQITEVSAQF
jgi:hypothetical protein